MTRIPSVMTESRSGFFFRPQALWQMVRLLGHLRNLVVHSNLLTWSWSKLPIHGRKHSWHKWTP